MDVTLIYVKLNDYMAQSDNSKISRDRRLSQCYWHSNKQNFIAV
jgi:hypothetical protein